MFILTNIPSECVTYAHFHTVYRTYATQSLRNTQRMLKFTAFIEKHFIYKIQTDIGNASVIGVFFYFLYHFPESLKAEFSSSHPKLSYSHCFRGEQWKQLTCFCAPLYCSVYNNYKINVIIYVFLGAFTIASK